MIHSFSTDMLAESERSEYWNEVVCKHCVVADSKISDSRLFSGKFSAKAIGKLEVSSMSSSLCTVFFTKDGRFSMQRSAQL